MATIKKISTALLLMGVLLFGALPREAAAGFNTLELIRDSVQLRCLEWKIIGLCFWLKCSPRCKIRITPKISHYLPDLTVTNSAGSCPWYEMSLLSLTSLSAIPSALVSRVTGGNPGQGGRLGRYAMKFKDSMVVGNPTAKLASKFGARFLCESQAKPLHIYFNSRQGLNALVWRGIDLSFQHGAGITDIDRLESWKPGSRVVGRSHTLGNTHGNTMAADSLLRDEGWGSIYPRRGTVLNPNDVKASAVIAQRAIEIVIRNPDDYHHVSSPNDDDGEWWQIWGDPQAPNFQQCRASGGDWYEQMQNAPFKTPGRCLQQRAPQQSDIGDEADDRWQMVYPVVENTCASFDQRAQQAADWSADKASEESAYAYNFWQKYKCCIPRSGLYLFSIEF